MLKKIFANTMAKKTTVFAAVFALSCVLMGGMLTSMNNESEFVETVMPQQKDVGQVVETVAAPFPVQTTVIRVEEAPQVLPSAKEASDLMQESAVQGQQKFEDMEKPWVDMSLPAKDGFVYSKDIPMSLELQKYTYNECVEKGLEYELVLALIWRESRFNADAVGHNQNGTKDSGIMQINDVNKEWLRKELGITDLMDPWQNIDAGTTMLSKFTGKYGVHDGLMAYQYGEAGMKQKIEQGVVTNDKITLLLNKREDFKSILQKT